MRSVSTQCILSFTCEGATNIALVVFVTLPPLGFRPPVFHLSLKEEHSLLAQLASSLTLSPWLCRNSCQSSPIQNDLLSFLPHLLRSSSFSFWDLLPESGDDDIWSWYHHRAKDGDHRSFPEVLESTQSPIFSQVQGSRLCHSSLFCANMRGKSPSESVHILSEIAKKQSCLPSPLTPVSSGGRHLSSLQQAAAD